MNCYEYSQFIAYIEYVSYKNTQIIIITIILRDISISINHDIS